MKNFFGKKWVKLSATSIVFVFNSLLCLYAGIMPLIVNAITIEIVPLIIGGTTFTILNILVFIFIVKLINKNDYLESYTNDIINNNSNEEPMIDYYKRSLVKKNINQRRVILCISVLVCIWDIGLNILSIYNLTGLFVNLLQPDVNFGLLSDNTSFAFIAIIILFVCNLVATLIYFILLFRKLIIEYKDLAKSVKAIN